MSAFVELLTSADTTTKEGQQTWADVDQAIERVRAQSAVPRVVPLNDRRLQTLMDLASGISVIEEAGAA